jgi:hypothetical protein
MLAWVSCGWLPRGLVFYICDLCHIRRKSLFGVDAAYL